ncbi:hypothetical protein LguiB_031752 [Lonicera macranthoides]
MIAAVFFPSTTPLLLLLEEAPAAVSQKCSECCVWVVRGPCCRLSNERKGGAEQAAGPDIPVLRPVVRRPGPLAAMPAAPAARLGVPARSRPPVRAIAVVAGQDGTPRAALH